MQTYRTPPSSLVVVAFGNSIFGVDAQTGARKWKQKVGTLETHPIRIAFANDCVYAACQTLTYIVRETGEVRWSLALDVTRGVLIVEGDLIFYGAGGNAFCYSATTGALLWKDDYKGHGLADVALGVPGNVAQALQ